MTLRVASISAPSLVESMSRISVWRTTVLLCETMTMRFEDAVRTSWGMLGKEIPGLIPGTTTTSLHAAHARVKRCVGLVHHMIEELCAAHVVGKPVTVLLRAPAGRQHGVEEGPRQQTIPVLLEDRA